MGMGVLSSELHDFTQHQSQVLEYFPKIWDFILPQTGLLRSMLGPLNLGPGGRSYNEPISCLQWFHEIKEKRNPKNLQRTSTHVLATPDPIPEPITPSTQPAEQKWPMGQQKSDFACLQKGLTVDRAGAYDILSYHQKKVRPP